MRIPQTLRDITPEWLTSVLGHAGLADTHRVSDCTVQRVGEQFGFASQVVRVRLKWSSDDCPMPRSLIVKLPADAGNAFPADLLRPKYEREAKFYRDIGPRAGVRVPRCYHVEWQPQPPQFVLVLEDLEGARFGDADAGWSREDAAAGIDSLAALHATWWRRAELREFEWLPAYGDFAVQLARITERRHTFLERHGALLSPALRALTERIGAQHEGLVSRLAGPPETLVHVDAHLDNFAFMDLDGRLSVVIFDWQGVARGLGVVDLASFVKCASIERRREHEAELLRRYHGALEAGGVRDYTFEQMREDYRLALLRQWIGTVNGFGSSYSASWTGRQADLIRQGIERMCAAVMDHDLPALL